MYIQRVHNMRQYDLRRLIYFHNYLPICSQSFLLMLLKSYDHMDSNKTEDFKQKGAFAAKVFAHQNPLDLNV